MLQHALEDFFHYLQIERGLSENTLMSYRRDLNQYTSYVENEAKLLDWKEVERTDIMAFLYTIKDSGKSASTIARMISAIRSFHQFLIREQLSKRDPSLHIETPKQARILPDVLSTSEIDILLDIHAETPLSVRNKAMLELM